jgi:hypothetical protein
LGAPRQLEDIEIWSHLVRRATAPADHGVGAERTCSFGNVIRAWIAWDEGRSFAYEATGLPLVKRAHNVWSVHPENERQALLTTVAEVELKGGYFGRLLEPIMATVFRRMAPSSLAAFKYLVEKGHLRGPVHRPAGSSGDVRGTFLRVSPLAHVQGRFRPVPAVVDFALRPAFFALGGSDAA